MRGNSKLRSSLGTFMRVLCDLMVLNILWFFCSLPILTLGPATAALCGTMLKVARDEPISTLKVFFSAFRRDFLKSLLLGVLGLLGLFVAGVDWWFALAQEGGARILFFAVAVIVSTVVLSFWAWGFALHACFENSVAGTVKNALKLAFIAPGRNARMNETISS